ncbi:MAG: aminopeptidase, partial [Candidatus Nephrothrix sp. EaCA]
ANRINDAEVMNKMKDKNFYELTLTNKGGLAMPVIIQWKYKDGSVEIEKIPAEIWRNNEQKITKVFAKDKEAASVTIDPKEETSDIDAANNTFPREKQVSKFDDFKEKQKKK